MSGHKQLIGGIMAAVGTLLVWSPVLATLVTAAAGYGHSQIVRLDYLMPAELFPPALAGGGLLVGVALWTRLRQRIIVWSLGIMVGVLVGGQTLAVVTGLADGRIEPAGWPWAVVLASLGIYTLALLVLGGNGIILTGDLLRPVVKKPGYTGQSEE